MNNSKSSRALVISGGGARGAWGVGVAKALSLHCDQYYNLVVGTSTGSLMAPLILIRDFDTLSDAYTSVNQESIFNVNPFKSNGDIRYLHFVWRLIRGKATLGETQNLRKLIDTFITQDVYDKIRKDHLDFGVAVTSLTQNRALIKTASENSYEDMKEWMWASANEPVFMTTLYKDGEAWVDGGLKDYLPITYSIDKGFSDIDVIIHNAEDYTSKDWIQSGGIFGLLLRTLAIYGADVEESNLTIAQLKTQLKDVKEKNLRLNLYFMSQDQVERTENELIFDKTIMKDLVKEGYDSVVQGTIVKKSYP